MNSATISTIEDLKSFKWFNLAGKPLTENASTAVSIDTYDEMLKSIESNRWMNIRIQALNRITKGVREDDLELFKDWNTIAKEIMPFSKSITSMAIEHLDCQPNDKTMIEKHVYWDIHHLLLEAEYSHIIEPGFFAYISYWYSLGHLPCGWIGKIPQGKLLVY